MTWIIVAISICVVGFMVGVCQACCTTCHLLCEPETEPTASATVTLPAMADRYDCTNCAAFGDTFILDRLPDPFIYGFSGCIPFTFADACYWGFEIDPTICNGSVTRETLLLGLSGDSGGLLGFSVVLKLCFYAGFGGDTGDITWSGSFSESLPFDCDTLGTRTLEHVGTELEAFCTTTDDASVTF